MAEGPILETPRLRIVPFCELYLTPRYVAWLNDPDVVRYSEQRHRVHTLESCRSYWLSFSGTPHFFWAIIVADGTFGPLSVGNAIIRVDTTDFEAVDYDTIAAAAKSAGGL